jgi:hypothetical protein
MQNLSNTPVPQWKIKYDNQFNVQQQQIDTISNTAPENGGGKIPWFAFLIGGLMVFGFVASVQRSQQQNKDKSQTT